MSAIRILLAEKDLEYGHALSKAISNINNEFEITLTSFQPGRKNSSDTVIDFLEFELILLGGYPAETAETIRKKFKIGNRIVILTDYAVENLLKQAENEGDHFWYVYKYVDVNDFISDLNYLAVIVAGKKKFVRKNMAPEMIGFYSISGGTGKTVIAMSTARELTRYHDKKVLYLSFEDIPAFELFGNSLPHRNIGDFLYYLFEKNVCSCPEGFTSTDHYGVESFYSNNGRNDLNLLTQHEMIHFLKTLSDSSRYDFIILDLKSDLSEDTLFLVNLCSRIILVQNNEPVSRFKNQKLIAYLDQTNLIDINKRLLSVINRTTEDTLDIDDTVKTCKKIKSLRVEKDEDSFRFSSNLLEIDLNNAFGIGIKKIARELIHQCTENYVL